MNKSSWTQDVPSNNGGIKKQLSEFMIEWVYARIIAAYISKQWVTPHMFVDTVSLWVKGKNIWGEDLYTLIRVVSMKNGEIAKLWWKYQVLELDSTTIDPEGTNKTEEVMNSFQARVQKTI